MIAFGALNSFEELCALWHEGGHVWLRRGGSRASRESAVQTKIFYNKMSKVSGEEKDQLRRKLEWQYKMRYQEIQQRVALAELRATSWAMQDMLRLYGSLGFNEAKANRAYQFFEAAWQSYDPAPIDLTALVSDRARSLSEVHKDQIRSFQRLSKQIINDFALLGLAEEIQIIVNDVAGSQQVVVTQNEHLIQVKIAKGTVLF
ncbi:hypothetical protein ACFLZP_00970 [Patescibacteria group bacterium]